MLDKARNFFLIINVFLEPQAGKKNKQTTPPQKKQTNKTEKQKNKTNGPYNLFLFAGLKTIQCLFTHLTHLQFCFLGLDVANSFQQGSFDVLTLCLPQEPSRS